MALAVSDHRPAMHKRTFKLPRLMTITALAVASWLLIIAVGWAALTLLA